MFEEVEGILLCRCRVLRVRASYFSGSTCERPGNLGEVPNEPAIDVPGTGEGTGLRERSWGFERTKHFRILASDGQLTYVKNVIKVIDPRLEKKHFLSSSDMPAFRSNVNTVSKRVTCSGTIFDKTVTTSN